MLLKSKGICLSVGHIQDLTDYVSVDCKCRIVSELNTKAIGFPNQAVRKSTL